MRVQVVPLKEAMSINGLRAVFGEQYPDPVRVVAVGNKVADMVAAPNKDDWLTGSVELCGGTHIKNTKEAHGFALVNEEASARPRPETSSACVCLLPLLYLGACCSAALSWRLLLLCVGVEAADMRRALLPLLPFDAPCSLAFRRAVSLARLDARHDMTCARARGRRGM